MKKKILIIATAMIVLVACISINAISTKKSKAYFELLKEASDFMIEDVYAVQEISEMIKDALIVHYTETITEEESVKALYAEEEFSQKILKLEENLKKSENYMVRLKNPPKKYEKTHEAMKDFYVTYSDLITLITEKRYTTISFWSDYDDFKENASKSYNNFQIMLY